MNKRCVKRFNAFAGSYQTFAKNAINYIIRFARAFPLKKCNGQKTTFGS